mgnify:CR=1 FL=1
MTNRLLFFSTLLALGFGTACGGDEKPDDTAEADTWGRLGGSKDDLYIYTPGGVLHAYLPGDGSAGSTDMSTDEGFQNVKAALLDAYGD